MASDLKDYLKKDLIVSNLNVSTREEIFKEMSNLLKKAGYVKDSFFNGLKEREKVFPTGLLLGKYNVAIPHTDVIHVNKPAIAVATLKNPVEFCCMDGNGNVSVNVIFMMALKEPHSQVLMLQQLMYLIQNEELLKKILQAQSSEEIYDILSNFKFEN